MNPLIRILSSLIISINKLIDSMSLQTIQTIKRGFFFTIFIFCIIGIIIGINMGKHSAKIKSAPLAEYVNDTFRIDLNKEKDAGDFSEMLENEVINDSTINNFNKAEFPVRDSLDIQYSKEPLEIQNKVPMPDLISKPSKSETPIDEDLNRTITENETTVRALEKNLTDDNKKDIIINQSIEPEKNKIPGPNNMEKTPVRILEKNKIIKPEIINKDSGVINQ